MSTAIGIGISPVFDNNVLGAAAPVVPSKFILEASADFILLESGDFLLQE